MTDKDRIHRWMTQADLERMLNEAHRRGMQLAIDELQIQCRCEERHCPVCVVTRYLQRDASLAQGHEWTMAEGIWHCRQCYVVRDENPKPCRVSA